MKIRRWWEANFSILEFLLSLIICLVFIIWSEYIDNRQFLNSISSDSRATIYGTLASLFGSLLGFSITAVSIVLGYSANEKLAIVRESKKYKDLWDVFTSAIRVLGFATIFSLMGLFFDKGLLPNIYILYLNVFASILSFFRIARCVWVLENIILIVTRDVK